MTTVQEKRRYQRFSLEGMKVSGEFILAPEIRVLNMSVGGVAVKADRRLNVGSEYMLKLECKNKTLSLKATVVWSSLSGIKTDSDKDVIPTYTTGMKFKDLSNEKMKEIINFMNDNRQNNAYKLSGLRLYTRVSVDSIAANLNFPESYRVKYLSLGGLLIVSEQALDIGRELHMEIALNESQSIKFLGKVASSRLIKDTNPECYGIGIAILDMTVKDREILNEFISLFDCK